MSELPPAPGPDQPTAFTPRAQQVLSLARKEALRLHRNYLGSEHLLLGLILLGSGVAFSVLQRLGLELDAVRKAYEQLVGPSAQGSTKGSTPYTPRTKKILALAISEAKQMGHAYVGTEHLLLGLLREEEGVAARIFQSFKVDLAHTRHVILKELDPRIGGAGSGPSDAVPSA